MHLWNYEGKKVELILKDGKIVTGKVKFWNDDFDSCSGEEELVIGSKIYAESDFKSIEVIKEV